MTYPFGEVKIKETDLMPEAFIYKFTHRPTSRWYLGMHGLKEDESHLDGAYWNSSSDEEFKELLQTKPHEFLYEISQYGNMEMIYKKENEILESLDAKSPVSHNSDAPIVIAKRYGLESKKDPNDFDEVFVEKVAQDDLIDAFDYGLKRIDEMAALDKSMTKADINERKKEWAKDANGLMLRITNAVETVQMRLVEGGLIHETVSGRSNPNQDFKNRPWAPGEAGYDMIKLDRNFIVRSKDGKTLRKIDLDNLVGGDVTPATVHAYIQDIISKQKLVDGDLRQ